MGIVINVDSGTFSIQSEKLLEIHTLCEQAFLRDLITRCEFQSLLGKLLYIPRYMKASRVFLSRLLMFSSDRIALDVGGCESLLWFLTFMKKFNGIVCFNKPTIQYHVYDDASLQWLGSVWSSCVYSTLLPTEIIGEMSIKEV